MNPHTQSIQPGANIKIRSVPNLRDLGGWQTRDGACVRYGRAFRGVELGQLEGDDLTAFSKLGIRTVYDFRTEPERTAHPDRLPPGVQHIVADVLQDMQIAAPAQLLNVFDNPQTAQAFLESGKTAALFEQVYRQLITLPSACAAYHKFFTDLSDETQQPVYFHCTTGKDRTGWAAASLLSLLEVPDELIMQEYLLTNEQLLPALQPVFDKFQAGGGDPELLRPMLGVSRTYLAAAFDEMRQRFGTLEQYLSKALGVDENHQAALRELFIEHG